MFGAILDALIPGRSAYDQWDDPSNRSPWADFWYTPLGIPEQAGAPTANGMMFTSACFAATRLLCGLGSTSPLNLMKRETLPDGRVQRTIQSDHPVHVLLNMRSSPDQTSIAWRSQQVAWQVNWGTAFAEIDRDPMTGKPAAFWSIHPRRMQPFRDKDLNLWWHVKQKDGTTIDLPDSDLLRFPYIVSEDGGITGLGVAYQARRAIGLAMTLERSETQASKSGTPRIVVETPKMMNPDARVMFRREWKELYEQGGEGVALLTDGAVAKPLDWKMTDQQHVQRREFTIEDLARWYDVPLNMLRRAIKEMAGNIEQQGIDFKTYSLRFLDIWLQELAYKLLTREEIEGGYYFAYDFADLIRGDLKALSEFFRTMNTVGAYSANDILDRLGENPHAKGDTYFVQGAMRPIDEPYNATEPQKPPIDPKLGKGDPAEMKGAENAVRILMESTLKRMAFKEQQAANQQAKKGAKFFDGVEEFYIKHREQLAEALEPICAAAKELGRTIDAKTLADGWCDASLKELLEASGTATPDELPEVVSACVSSWNSDRVINQIAAIVAA